MPGEHHVPTGAKLWLFHRTTPVGGWRGGRVVYCGGLENRFGFTADGGSNPSLSANVRSGVKPV
jgi:hypothetical protein